VCLGCLGSTCGDDRSIPASFRSKPPPEPGSGKFGIPCERMQAANATAADAEPGPVALALPDEDVLDAGALVVVRLATEGGIEAPPQPAATRPRPVTPAASTRTRACACR
jgi:hypothetical protein